MTDRELLELAAKAGGIIGEYESWTGQGFKDGIRQVLNGAKCLRPWNPRTDDGDALRLAVSLDLFSHPRFFHERDVLMFTENIQKLEATRRAIVRAAAEIGKAMQQEHRRTTL